MKSDEVRILVTTKSGSNNKPLAISARVNFGVATIDKSTEFRMMSQEQYLAVAKEAWANAGNSPDFVIASP